MNPNLSLNSKYSKEEIENIFDTNFGRQIKGITLRRWKDGTPYIIVFSRASGPYTDRIEGDSLYYDGEGKDKDQTFSGANKILAEANITGRVIYGFRQEDEDATWKYIGILKVVDYLYFMKKGFMTYEFRLKQTGIDTPEEESIEFKELVEQSTKDVPELTGETTTTTVKKKSRDDAFRTEIKKIYDNSCAVCGKKRFTNANYPEVEAAHIYPKEKNGSDDFRNGLALCKLHHWAFDGGLFSINNDYSIVVKDNIKTDVNYEEIYNFDGQKIRMPNDGRFNPHQLFLEAHRKLHGFEDGE